MFEEGMAPNMLSNIHNKATKLYVFSRVISLYFTAFSAFYAINYTQNIVIHLSTPISCIPWTAS